MEMGSRVLYLAMQDKETMRKGPMIQPHERWHRCILSVWIPMLTTGWSDDEVVG